jgi:hypothetical protein
LNNRQRPDRPWLTTGQQSEHDLRQARLQTFIEQQEESTADLTLFELRDLQHPPAANQDRKNRPSWYSDR